MAIPQELPPPPAHYGEPVKVANPKRGEDARAVAARERAGRLANAARLKDDKLFYEDVRKPKE